MVLFLFLSRRIRVKGGLGGGSGRGAALFSVALVFKVFGRELLFGVWVGNGCEKGGILALSTGKQFLKATFGLFRRLREELVVSKSLLLARWLRSVPG